MPRRALLVKVLYSIRLAGTVPNDGLLPQETRTSEKRFDVRRALLVSIVRRRSRCGKPEIHAWAQAGQERSDHFPQPAGNGVPLDGTRAYPPTDGESDSRGPSIPSTNHAQSQRADAKNVR